MLGAGTTRAMRAALVFLAATVVQAGERHVQLIAETPCLFEYRKWFFTFGRKPSFSPPEGFTAEQCDKAVKLHEVIQAELAAEDDAESAERANRHLQAEKAAARDAEQARAQEALERATRAARAKLPGVSIGMTPRQVVDATSWGRPERVNRTTNALGVSEQWVYPGSNYLYFQDGVLTSIQTSR